MYALKFTDPCHLKDDDHTEPEISTFMVPDRKFNIGRHSVKLKSLRNRKPSAYVMPLCSILVTHAPPPMNARCGLPIMKRNLNKKRTILSCPKHSTNLLRINIPDPF